MTPKPSQLPNPAEAVRGKAGQRSQPEKAVKQPSIEGKAEKAGLKQSAKLEIAKAVKAGMVQPEKVKAEEQGMGTCTNKEISKAKKTGAVRPAGTAKATRLPAAETSRENVTDKPGKTLALLKTSEGVPISIASLAMEAGKAAASTSPNKLPKPNALTKATARRRSRLHAGGLPSCPQQLKASNAASPIQTSQELHKQVQPDLLCM